MGRLRVVVAPDSFKGTAGAAAVAASVAEGWRSVRPGDHVTELPLADEATMLLHYSITVVNVVERSRPGPAVRHGMWVRPLAS